MASRTNFPLSIADVSTTVSVMSLLVYANFPVDPRVVDLRENKDWSELKELCRELGLSYQCQKPELAERIVATQVRNGATNSPSSC